MKVLLGEDSGVFNTYRQTRSNLIATEVCVTHRQERNLYAIKNPSFYKPREETKHVRVLVFTRTVVHLEIEGPGEAIVFILVKGYAPMNALDRQIRVMEDVVHGIEDDTVSGPSDVHQRDHQMRFQPQDSVPLRDLGELRPPPL